MTPEEVQEEVAKLDEFEKNCRWLHKYYDSLRPLYAGQFVAILKQQAVDHDEDIKTLVDRLEKNYPEEEGVSVIRYVSLKDFEMSLCVR